MEVRNLVSRHSIGRERRKTDGGESTNEAVEAPTRPVMARPRLQVAIASAPKPARVCYRFGKQSHKRANCMEKLCNRCNRRGHAGDVRPMSKERALLTETGEVGARVDVCEDGTVQASAFKVEETGEYGGGFGRMGDGELVWPVGDEAWICNSGASTHMTLSADLMISCRQCNLKLRIADGTNRSIERYGEITFLFRPKNDLVGV